MARPNIPLLALIAIVATTQLGPSCTYGQPVWDITEHGAKQGFDIAAVINEGLRTQPEHGLPVYIPSGRWGIGSTIELPKRQGGALIGAGPGGGAANDQLRGLGSILEWYGDDQSPMLRMTGSRWRIENLALRGKPFKKEGKRALQGLLVTKTGRGLGTGKHEFRNLSIAECRVGIQCGLDPAEHNNDLLGFERLEISRCEIGYRVINSQAMSHWINRLEVRNTPVAFQFFGGGMLHVRNIAAFDTTLLELRQNDPPSLSPGGNNAVYRLENLKVDAQHAGKFCLVDADEKVYGQVILDCGMISGPSEFTMARLGRKTQLVLRDVTSPTARAAIDKRPGTEVLLQNVRVSGLSKPD